ncbi:MAG: PKD domain-containing protein [Bacteroidetes bacterium]|nr:PKD domain-containing protein [Bacteroidota bacterium]
MLETFNSPTAGSIFSWTNDNTAIGLAASGTGDITSFTTTNTTTAPILANITVIPTANSCVGTPSTYSITVNPTPTVVVPSNIIICDGATTTTTNFTSPTAGTTFSWTNDNTAIGLAANGTGNITSFTATNTTTAPILANITVTPTANTCVGIPSTYSITVNPTPTVVVPLDTILCDAAIVSTTNFTSSTSGSTFAWTNDNTAIGLAANGTGNITSFTVTNTITAPITANITVTPTANSCVGIPSTYSITVHPLPTPNFTFPNVCFGTTTIFADLSNANGGIITNWNWDFTDNGSVDNTTQNPTNGYPAAGSYIVELMVQTALGCMDSITKTVTVNPIPVANFSAPDVCLNTTTAFTDLSTVTTGTIQSYFWDFADGSGTDTLPSPNYLYGAANTYNVSLTVTSDSNCINTIVIPVTVFNNPIAAFTTTDVCQNITANFDSSPSNGNGGTIDQYDWDIDFDGTTHTTDYTSQNATNDYAIANTYTVELIVTTIDGCSDTITNPITIFPMPNATYSFTDTCYGIANSFTDNSTVSSSTITNWDWDFGNTNISTTQNPTQLYAADGQYSVTLIVTTDNFCKDTITQTINVWPLPVVDFTPTEVCLNTSTQFTDLSIVSLGNNAGWAWNFDDGTPLNFSQNPMHTYAADGTFQAELFVTTNHACKDSLTKTVTVHPNPVVRFVSDSLDGCAGVIANFTDNSYINAPSDSSLFTWNWDFGNGLTSTNQNPQGIIFGNTSSTSTALYTVSLTVTAGALYGSCSTTNSVMNMITVYPKPIADFTFSPQQTDIYDREITFIDNSVIASQWLWNLGDGDSSIVPNPIHEYADSGSYLVTLFIENTYGCKDTTQKLVKIDPVFVIFIPNAFTPAGDNLNDYFSVKGYGITQIEMFIFDRWGEKIWEGHQLDGTWDGTYKGKIVEQDVYVYKIRVKDIFYVWHEYIGKVTVIK